MLQTTKSERTIRTAGFTLVELMVSLLIVGIVMMGWWRIMNATSPYREAQRRAAVEVAAGVLDILSDPLFSEDDASLWVYQLVEPVTSGRVTKYSMDKSQKIPFPAGWLPHGTLMRYTLTVEGGVTPSVNAWQRWSSGGVPVSCVWSTIRLYDRDETTNHFAVFTQLLQVIQ